MGGELPFFSRFVKSERMADDISSLLSPTDMEVIERVLNMRSGYVMDFSDRTFDNFIAHEIGVDATAPRFTVDGASKAKRLRRILPTLSAGPLAKLLRSFLEYRDSPARDGRVDLLDDEWRKAYKNIFESLELSVAQANRNFEEKKSIRSKRLDWPAHAQRTSCRCPWSSASGAHRIGHPCDPRRREALQRSYHC